MEGLDTKYAVAIWQAVGLGLKVTLSVIWSWLTFRICRSAHYKQMQGFGGLLRTTVYAASRNNLAECVSLAVLLAVISLTGFYATLMTSVLDTVEYGDYQSLVPVLAEVEPENFLSSEIDQSMWRLTDGSVARQDFELTSGNTTELEYVEVPLLVASFDDTARVLDAKNQSWHVPAATRTSCPAKQEVSQYSTGQWTADHVVCGDYKRGDLLGNVTAIGWIEDPRWYKDQSHRELLLFDGKNLRLHNSNIEVREVYSIGLDVYALAESLIKFTAVSGVWNLSDTAFKNSIPLDVPETPYTEVRYKRHTLEATKGVVTERKSEFTVARLTTGTYVYEGYDVNRTYVAVGNYRPTALEYEKQLAKSTGVSTSDTSDQDAKLARGRPLNEDGHTDGLRALLTAVTEKYVMVTLRHKGYRVTDILYSVSPLAVLGLVVLYIWLKQDPFEANTLTENMYVNNNTELNDCASNRWSRDKRWWYPERWTTLVIDAGVWEDHVSVVLGGKLLKTADPPVLLAKLGHGMSLVDKYSAHKLWAQADMTPEGQKQALANLKLRFTRKRPANVGSEGVVEAEKLGKATGDNVTSKPPDTCDKPPGGLSHDREKTEPGHSELGVNQQNAEVAAVNSMELSGRETSGAKKARSNNEAVVEPRSEHGKDEDATAYSTARTGGAENTELTNTVTNEVLLGIHNEGAAQASCSTHRYADRVDGAARSTSKTRKTGNSCVAHTTSSDEERVSLDLFLHRRPAGALTVQQTHLVWAAQGIG